MPRHGKGRKPLGSGGPPGSAAAAALAEEADQGPVMLAPAPGKVTLSGKLPPKPAKVASNVVSNVAANDGAIPGAVAEAPPRDEPLIREEHEDPFAMHLIGKRGGELTGASPGSKEAADDYLWLMNAADADRVRHLARLLRTNGGNQLEIFYHLLTLLPGKNDALAATYLAYTRGASLRRDLDRKLSERQAEYCTQIVEHGQPRFCDRVALALGLVTGARGDKRDVWFLFEESKPAPTNAEKLEAWRLYSEHINKVDKVGRIQTQMATLVADIRGVGRESAEMLALKDQEVTAIARSCEGKLALRRAKLGEVLPVWARKQAEEVRKHVTNRGSVFWTYLHDQIGSVWSLTPGRALFTEKDREYALRIVRDNDPLDAKFFQEDEPAPPDGPGGAKRKEELAEHGSTHIELAAYIDRKENRTDDLLPGNRFQWKTVLDKIEELSPEDRDWYLRSLLAPAERDEWDHHVGHPRHAELRAIAIGLLDEKLKRSGMRTPGFGRKKLLGKGDEVRERILAAFTYGAPAGVMQEGSTYQRLTRLADDGPKHPDAFGQKMLALARKLRGDELAHVRGSPELLAKLRRQSAHVHIDHLHAMLGLTAGAHDGASGQVDDDVLNATENVNPAVPVTVDKKKHDLDEARALGAREAELMPSHWAMVLAAALTFARQLRRTEINSIVTRAWRAGQQRERLTERGQVRLSGTRTLEPMTAQAFVRAVHASLPAEAREVLEEHRTNKLRVAYEALVAGQRPSVDDQLADADFRNPLKKTSGYRAAPENVARLYQDLDGLDLITSWSNIGELAIRKGALDAAIENNDDEQAGLLRAQVRDFVLDIRDDRRAELAARLPTVDLVEGLAAVRKKLLDAARTDPQVIKLLASLGYENDEYSQARTHNMSLLDGQRLRAGGAQYNKLLGTRMQVKVLGKKFIGSSPKSAESKEATGILLGETRKAQADLRQPGADREKVNADHAKPIEQAQEDLERRGENFDKMQKKFNKVVEYLVKALCYATAAAATAALTALTGGVGGVAMLGVVGGKVLLKHLVVAGLKKALEGDAYNAEKEIWNAAIKMTTSLATGALGAFGVPEILEVLGHEVLEHGDHLATATSFAEPANVGEAAMRPLIDTAMTTTARQVMRATLDELRRTDANVAYRMIGVLHFGALVAHLGAAVAAGAWGEYNEAIKKDPSLAAAQPPADALGAVLAGTEAGTKAAYRGAKLYVDHELEGLAAVTGEDHALGTRLDEMVAAVLADAATRVGELQQSRDQAPDAERAGIDEQIGKITRRRDRLQARYEWYKNTRRDKHKAAELDEANGGSKGVISALFKLLRTIDRSKRAQPAQPAQPVPPAQPAQPAQGGQP